MASQGSFWARRKAGVEAEAIAEAAAARAAVEAAEAEALATAYAEKTDDELLADLGLPDPDTLTKGDDFSAFMGRAVPEHLRRRALRKLWLSNPVLANLDGLVDHGEDYTDAATVTPGMQTAYQVGKGMMSHVLALAEKAATEAEAEARLARGESTSAPAEEAVEDVAEQTTSDPAADRAPRDYADAAPEATPAPRRHMRFEFTS